MKIPEQISGNIKSRLLADGVLSESTSDEVVQGLDDSKPINWNVLLNKEIQPKKEGVDETND
jgi:hypothetical protein